MSERLRDHGLVRAVGPWGLAASVVNVVVGGAIFAVPGALAASVGAGAPLVFLVCAVSVGAVAICFAEGGSRVPTSGGPYGTIEAAFGSLAGYVTGTLLWVGDVLACGSIAAALADAAAACVAPSLKAAVHAGVIVVAVGAVALVNVTGVARGVRLVSVATAIKLVPLAVFVVVGATATHATSFLAGARPGHADLGRAVILSTFAFMGMESSLCASGEVVTPSRTIPRALAISMVSVTALYVVIQVVAQGLLGASLASSPAPLADGMGRIHPALRQLMLVGAGVSMLGWIASDLLGTPRVVFALAQDGWLPRALAAVHPRTRVPHVAILAYAGVAIGLALSGTFAELAVLSTLATAPIYVGGCAAAWALARRRVALAGEPLGFRYLGTAALVGAAGMVATIALASHAELAGLVVLLGLCGVTYLPLSRRMGPSSSRTSR